MSAAIGAGAKGARHAAGGKGHLFDQPVIELPPHVVKGGHAWKGPVALDHLQRLE